MSVKLGVAPIAWSNDDMPERDWCKRRDKRLDERTQ